MDFAVVFNASNSELVSDDGSSSSSKKAKQAILMFCKEATDRLSMENPDAVLGNVVNADMFHDPS